MSTLGDALNAIKSIILIEERVKTQSLKLEKIAELLVDLDRRLVRVETTLDLAMRHTQPTGAPLVIPHETEPAPPAGKRGRKPDRV